MSTFLHALPGLHKDSIIRHLYNSINFDISTEKNSSVQNPYARVYGEWRFLTSQERCPKARAHACTEPWQKDSDLQSSFLIYMASSWITDSFLR